MSVSGFTPFGNPFSCIVFTSETVKVPSFIFLPSVFKKLTISVTLSNSTALSIFACLFKTLLKLNPNIEVQSLDFLSASNSNLPEETSSKKLVKTSSAF